MNFFSLLQNMNFFTVTPLSLQLTFIILKQTKFIAWSWWLVLLPSIIICGVLPLVLLIITFFKK